ncbi:Rhamnogalacturonate lyase A [Peziza echinospora]|nr:Rhamnogalacturonate lyase A [Peziza echinospora]
MKFSLSACLVVLATLTDSARAAFGLTQSGTNYVVDTGAGLVFQVSRNTGDINSLLYNNIQVQDSSKFSHINSGLGSNNVQGSVINNQYIKIVVYQGDTTQFIIAKQGDPIIYMATYITAEPSVGELRFIARLKKSAVPNGNPYAEIEGGTAIEGSDVFKVANGNTRAKFYSSKSFIDDQVHCVSGSGVGVCMVVPDTSYESSSGGPFFRDIDNQGGAQQELYFYMNSGHVQTESYRMGLHGPYALVFTSGGTASSSLDFSFFSQLSVTGFYPKSARGYVSGSVSGVSSDGVVHWFNSNAQYWVKSTGGFTSPAMKPGSYTMRLYKGELLVQTLNNINVNAGQTTNQNIVSAENRPSSVVFRIGEADGRPTGFKNAANQLIMHPSDSRMQAWNPTTVTWGQMSTGDFPMAQIKGVNDPTTINFSVSNNAARTLRILTTLSFAGARPTVRINGSYSPAVPAAPTKIDSRGFTRGAYRGYGEVYEFTIPAGTLQSGSNKIEISAASGSSGDTFLSPNFIYDCVELF